MGVRYRKSLKAGPFRVNFSKSGVGWSVGGKGYRYTKTANGRTRKTYSVPGTGLSYVTENGKKRTSSNNNYNPQSNVTGSTESLINLPGAYGTSEKYESQTQRLNNVLMLNSAANWLLVSSFLVLFNSYFISLPLIALIIKLVILFGFNANLNYSFGDDQVEEYNKSINTWNFLLENSSLRLLLSRVSLESTKNSAEVASHYNRDFLKVKIGTPWYIKTNISVVQLNLKGTKILVLPQAIMIIRKNNACVYDGEFDLDAEDTEFTEGEAISPDAKIIRYTYLHVNKNGQPDKRYKDNPKIPICLYKHLTFSTDFGLQFQVLCPNVKATDRFVNEFHNLDDISKISLSDERLKEQDVVKKDCALLDWLDEATIVVVIGVVAAIIAVAVVIWTRYLI